MRKFFVLIVFFFLTPLVLGVSIYMVSSQHSSQVLGISTKADANPFAFAALPSGDRVFEASATLSDKRPLNLENYLATYHSPLEPYAGFLVNKADEYGIDYRLLTAIAMQETTLCKKTLAKAPYNCWGWGIWGKHAAGFSSYEDAIDTISRYFASKKEGGIESLEAIGKIYNPGNTNHWKENVALVMSQL